MLFLDANVPFLILDAAELATGNFDLRDGDGRSLVAAENSIPEFAKSTDDGVDEFFAEINQKLLNYRASGAIRARERPRQ